MTRDPALLALGATVCVLGVVPPEAAGEAAAGAAVLALLFVALRIRDAARTDAARVLLALAIPAVLAGRFADAPGAAVDPLALAALAAGTGIAASTGDRKAALRITATALAAAGAIAGLRGLYDVFWGGRVLLDAIATIDVPDRERIAARLAEGRAYAGFATPASLGGFLAMSLPVTVGAALAEAGRRRGWLLGAAALQLAGLLAARSITAIGALAVATVALAILLRARRWIVPAAAAALLLVLVVVSRGRPVVSTTDDDSPWRLRAGNVRTAFEIAWDHPWLGVGPGGYAEAFPRYRRGADNEARHAHSLPAELAAEWGIPVGGLLAVGFYSLFLGPLLRRAAAASGLERGAAVAMSAFAVQNLADFTSFLPTGILVASVLRGVATDSDPETHPPDPGWGVGLLAVVGAAALLVGSSGLAWNARFEARMARARDDRAGETAKATRATRWAPWSVDGAILRAQALYGSARLLEAAAEADRAVARSPVRAAARDLRATVRAARGDGPGAYADAREAARLYPLETAYRDRRDAWAARLSTPGAP